MESPLIIALSRQMASSNQVDSIANNIANMNTTGYKGERPIFNQFLTDQQGQQQMTFPKYIGLHRETEAGPINATDNPLDVALRGDGFLVINTATGPRYTRDGHFSLNVQGQLVNSRGLVVSGSNDQPIVVPPGTSSISISEDGDVSADSQQVGKLKLVQFDNQQRLQRTGDGLFTTDAPALPATNTDVLQGSLEGSNIQPIVEITRMIEASRVYQSAQKVINSEDERIRDAVTRLAKVA
ncbi:MAG TPA: flagellar basal-body rod protein FlgF [Alphaproteobacteria bacterium]